MISVWLWLLHRITGVLLIFFLVFHIAYFHLFDGSFSATEIKSRLNSIVWKGYYLLFLFSVIYHGTYGIVLILKEYLSKYRWLNVSYIVLVIVVFYLAYAGLRFLFF